MGLGQETLCFGRMVVRLPSGESSKRHICRMIERKSNIVPLTKIIIKGLFGLFDHSICLHKEGPLTIIHGPNGIGKTTILRLVESAFRQRFDRLFSTPFQVMRLESADASYLEFKKSSKRVTPRGRLRAERGAVEDVVEEVVLHIVYKPARGDQVTHDVPQFGPLRPEIHGVLRHLDDFVPSLEKIGAKLWYDRDSMEELGLHEVLARYGSVLPSLFGEVEKRVPMEIIQAIEREAVHLIETQRLLMITRRESVRARSHGRYAPTVETHAEEMSGIIQQALARSAEISQSLDRSFASRVLAESPGEVVSESSMRKRYKEQLTIRERLMKVGVLALEEPVALPERDLQGLEERVLWHYLADVTEKLSVFETLLKKLELLSETINARFLYKRMRIDREKGFVFEAPDGSSVPLNALSSGEQHELVLMFELLFRAKAKSLIMIDEPEISLHVTWQQRFLDDLLRISELTGLAFLVATHSPQIIHKRWNLAIALGEG